MLIDKYKPNNLNEIIGNKPQIKQITEWINRWKKGNAIMLHGPTGTGKSLTIGLIAKSIGYEIICTSANEDRSYKEFLNIIKSSSQKSIFQKNKIIVVDDAEQMESGKAVIELIAKSDFPVAVITDDSYSSSIRNYCVLVKFDKIRYDYIEKFLAAVAENEGIKIEKKFISYISRSCNGDIRAALTDMESGSAGVRDYNENIFETLKIIFKTTSLENAKTAQMNSDGANLFSWVSENIGNEYEDMEDIAKSLNSLSKADIFNSRILRRQAWSLQKYFFDLSTIGVSLRKKQQYKKFTKYARPMFRRHLEDDFTGELAKATHTSRRKSAVYRDLVKIIR